MYGLRRYRCRILVFPRKVMEVLNPALDAEQAMQARVCATSKFQAKSKGCGGPAQAIGHRVVDGTR